LPDIVALTGSKSELWQRGQTFQLGPALGVEVLNPAADSTETRAEDRALVLLFHAGNQTLLWAGRIGAAAQQELLTGYPGLHADVLVMGTEPPPDEAWLSTLRVREWLQIPARERQLNSTDNTIVPDSCQVWPLEQTGAVDIHFQPANAGQSSAILLRPWLALPSQP
jgi:hypothetical protein